MRDTWGGEGDLTVDSSGKRKKREELLEKKKKLSQTTRTEGTDYGYLLEKEKREEKDCYLL